VEVRLWEATGYRLTGTYPEASRLSSPSLPGLGLDTKDIFSSAFSDNG
jgi:hypothetical protein